MGAEPVAVGQQHHRLHRAGDHAEGLDALRRRHRREHQQQRRRLQHALGGEPARAGRRRAPSGGRAPRPGARSAARARRRRRPSRATAAPEKRGDRQLVAAATMRSRSARGTGVGTEALDVAGGGDASSAVRASCSSSSRRVSRAGHGFAATSGMSARRSVALVERRVVEHALEQRAQHLADDRARPARRGSPSRRRRRRRDRRS